MRYSPTLYAKAIREVIKETPKPHHDDVVKNFCEMVAKNGDLTSSPKIVVAIAEQEAHEHGGKVVNVEFAREMSEAAIKKVTKRFHAHDLVSVKVTPALVAGVRITVDNEKELDESLQRKLNKLWHTKS